MPMFRQTGRIVGRTRSPGNVLRPVEWIRKCEFDIVVPAAGLGTLGMTLVTPAEFEDFTRPTVVRIRGELALHLADVTLGNQATVGYGVTLVNPDEPAPGPLGQARGNRWLWWGCCTLYNPPGATLAFEYGTSFWRLPFDIKAMRKRLVDGSSLLLCVVLDASSGGASVHADMSSSTLVKE